MNEYDKKIEELFSSLHKVTQKRLEYIKAVSEARKKSEELSTLISLIIKQPHIQINDYEIDN